MLTIIHLPTSRIVRRFPSRGARHRRAYADALQAWMAIVEDRGAIEAHSEFTLAEADVKNTVFQPLVPVIRRDGGGGFVELMASGNFRRLEVDAVPVPDAAHGGSAVQAAVLDRITRGSAAGHGVKIGGRGRIAEVSAARALERKGLVQRHVVRRGQPGKYFSKP